jgi:hypothetical protein
MTEKNTELATSYKTSSLAAMSSMIPETLTEMREFALMVSKANIIPYALKDQPSDVLIVLLTGHQHGLSPIQSLSSIHVIEGRAAMSADLLQAICLRETSVCEYFDIIETSNEVATYEAKRKGRQPIRMSFTIADAKAAGVFELTAKGKKRLNWYHNPADMLRARCKSKLARAMFPDLVLGLYTPDELEDIRAAEVVVTASPVVVTEAEPFDLDTGEVAEPPRDRI